MSEQIREIADGFWNIRGDFKVLGFLNIGTHASLARKGNGNFVLLDAYSLNSDLKQEVDAISNNGDDIEAIVNLHPFHTIHVKTAHDQYPNAKLYGTQRHIEKFPRLHWQPELTESEEFAELFSDDFDFSVPAGVDFISSNEKLHFSSVLAYHRMSQTIHVDDTLIYLKLPGLLGKFIEPQVRFHMTLSKTLEHRVGAAREFRAWAMQLADEWSDAKTLCAAHSAVCPDNENQSLSFSQRVTTALEKVEKTLQHHERKFG